MPSGYKRIEFLLTRPRVHLRGLYEAIEEVKYGGDLSEARDALAALKRDHRTRGLTGSLEVFLHKNTPTEDVVIFDQEPAFCVEVCSAVSEELLAHLAEFPEERFRLAPHLFEETVAEMLARDGWEPRLTPRTGDQGRDIIATRRVEPVPFLLLVECKRYSKHRPVTPEPVTRILYRLNVDRANMGMVVTTSRFWPSAQKVAMERSYQMSLKDGEEYIAWIRRVRGLS